LFVSVQLWNSVGGLGELNCAREGHIIVFMYSFVLGATSMWFIIFFFLGLTGTVEYTHVFYVKFLCVYFPPLLLHPLALPHTLEGAAL
jgi:hypothetical protein